MLSRRKFLAASAAAVAAPTILARAASAAANDRLAVGFIGVGTMGRYHLGKMLGTAGVEVVAVCDVVRERRDSAVDMVSKRYAERIKSGDYKGVKAYADFRELLDLAGLDAVVIATPDHWHAIPCLLAARAGKHIYCEKPLTHNITEGRQIVDEVKKAKIVFQTGSQQRSEFGGHFRKAVEYIWNGRIGKVHTVRIGVGGPARPCDLPAEKAPEGTDWDFWLGPAPERPYHHELCPKGVHQHFPAWRNYSEYAGGQLADMGAHHFDIAQWALETDRSGPIEVVPPTKPGSGRGLRFVYDGGVMMIHDEFEGDARADCVFEGPEGKILVSRSGISSRPASVLAEPLGKDARHVMASSDHHRNWLDAVRAGKPDRAICPAEIGHRSASICHLGNLGYRLGRKLKWGPAAEKFAGDEEAQRHTTREPRPKWKV
jgi:predicted dehydrogenase